MIDHYPIASDQYDIVINQMTPNKFAPLTCVDGRIRIFVRQSNLRDGTVWSFYIGKSYVRFLTYPMMPTEVRELLAQLRAETANVKSTTPVILEAYGEYPPPSCDSAGYKVSDMMYVMYISQQAFDVLSDITHSLTSEDVQQKIQAERDKLLGVDDDA